MSHAVQRWILKKSHKIRHSRRSQNIRLPTKTMQRQNVWQAFLKQYGASAGNLTLQYMYLFRAGYPVLFKRLKLNQVFIALISTLIFCQKYILSQFSL